MLVAWTAACNPLEVPIEAGDAVDRYHRRYNAGQIDAVWNEADPMFRQAAGRAAMEFELNRQRMLFGKLLRSERIGVQYMKNLTGGRSRWSIVMLSRFEFGLARESFLISTGDEPRIMGYNLHVHHILPERINDLRARGILPIGPPAMLGPPIVVTANR